MKEGVVSNNYLSCKYKYIYQGLGPPTILVLRQYEDLLRKLEKVMRIKTEDVVLDVGCGSGDLILSLAVRAGFVIGLDISKNSLYVAKSFYKNLAKVDFVLGDAEFLPFRGESFDKVFAFEVLEHLPSPFSSLREIWRLLKKEGMLIAYQQHYADVYALLWHKIKLRLGLTKERRCQLEREHINQYTPRGWLKIMIINGFDIKALLYIHAIPLLPFYPIFARFFSQLEPLFFEIPILKALDKMLLKTNLGRRMALAIIYVLEKELRSRILARVKAEKIEIKKEPNITEMLLTLLNPFIMGKKSMEDVNK